MARTVITQVTDDLDGSSNAEPLTFSVDNKHFEIDLSKKNRAALDRALKPYIEAARKAPKRGRGSAGSVRRRSAVGDLADIRAWAQAHGISVASRGRIAQSVVDQYRAAERQLPT
jgi:hypothetical protein